jgi:beta-1,2-N-acetylglucosaminyltransferase
LYHHFCCSLKKENYEDVIKGLIKRATVLDHSKSPCEENFVPEKMVSEITLKTLILYDLLKIFQGEVFMMFIKMEEPKDFGTWKQVAKVRVFTAEKWIGCKFKQKYFSA